MALVTSYMVSAALILRQTEGLWRLPLGGGAWEALQRAATGINGYRQLNGLQYYSCLYTSNAIVCWRCSEVTLSLQRMLSTM
jgi:hypothetical protein